jgi:cytochrome c-type biogenesis protein CcmF
MRGAFLVRAAVLTSVHAFAVDPERGMLLLAILGVAAGAAFALFAWRAPGLPKGGVFAPVSRESSLVLNNLFLSAAAATVLLGTLYPLILEAVTGETISVGPPYFNLTFTPLMAVALIILPAGPLLAWKRADLKGVVQRLTLAFGVAVIAALIALFVFDPMKALAAAGIGLGVWLIAGALAELAERIRLFRAPRAEVWRRLTGLPVGAFGMTLAHAGLGLFVMGAVAETAFKIEAVAVTAPGGPVAVAGPWHVTLDDVRIVEGPNYLAEQGVFTVAREDGAGARTLTAERRFFPAGGQTTTEVGLDFRGLDDVYVVLGERRATDTLAQAWTVRVHWNPWARLIFLGPTLMALGGLVSLSDRRLRFGVAGRKRG